MFLLSSLIACLILAIIMPVLGQYVLKRRIVFIDLALAQCAAMGYAIGLASGGSGILWAASVTLVAVFVFATLPYHSTLPKEAVMGSMYAVAAAAGMIVLAQFPHAEGHMSALMFGSLLGADWPELILLACLGLLAVITLRFTGKDNYQQRLLFYMGLSLAIVPAIHVVGIVLVFAMLLLPALAVWKNGQNGALWLALLIAVISAFIGIMAAETFDLPPSSAVVLALFICSLPSFLWNIRCSLQEE